jgi:hypothetical protein
MFYILEWTAYSHVSLTEIAILYCIYLQYRTCCNKLQTHA